MARKREGIVQEGLELLMELEERYRKQPQEVRIKMLRLFKEEPELRSSEIASIVGCSEQSIKRWWKDYQTGGLEGLLQVRNLGRRPTLDLKMDELRQMVLAGEINDVEDVRRWLQRVGISEKNGLGVHRQPPAVTFERDLEVPPKLLAFMNSMPTTCDVSEWINGFRAALLELLADVDRISVSVNQNCDLVTPEDYVPSTFYMQHVIPEEERSIDLRVGGDLDHVNRLVDNFRRQNFPIEQYYPPRYLVLYHKGRAYLGTMLFWRNRENPEISEKTMEFLLRLEPFFVFLLSDVVARNRYARPIDTAFNDALERLVQAVGLTFQEQRILVHQTLGYSYEEMAELLNLSLNTIRHHLKAIYQKTGTHGQSELFAKYFTPRKSSNKSHE